MARDEKLEKLRRVPLFAGLGKRELERLGVLTDEVDLPAGRVLMRQGDRGEELFVILRGAARAERDGRELSAMHADAFFGEIALVDGGPRTATVTLTEDSALLVLGRRQFQQVMEEFPDVRLQVLEVLAQRVRSAETDAVH
ncbi:MAG: cyclic nucleotide-binding domain-containing protein [Chloroflexota bacterium]